MKEKYLLNIKNAMLFHFTSSEIQDTLEELNTHFESAHNEGRPDTEIIKEYGSPAAFAKELLKETGNGSIRRNMLVIIKKLLLAACTLAAFLSFAFLPPDTASYILVACSSVIIWFLAGNNCLLDVLEITRQKKNTFIKSQSFIFILFILLQLLSYIIVPGIAGKEPAASLGRIITVIIYSALAVLFISAILFLKKMLDGSIYMFFTVIQSISIINSLLLYAAFLKNLETTDNMEFIFTPYLSCIPVLFIYWLYIAIKERGRQNGCTN
ncbi:MAG: DUF1700 domain-containing protein [Lachnospiraceae bacterium]|nr:DUF1700 domain-containing protein [Lachnospiraceae bacterium]